MLSPVYPYVFRLFCRHCATLRMRQTENQQLRFLRPASGRLSKRSALSPSPFLSMTSGEIPSVFFDAVPEHDISDPGTSDVSITSDLFKVLSLVFYRFLPWLLYSFPRPFPEQELFLARRNGQQGSFPHRILQAYRYCITNTSILCYFINISCIVNAISINIMSPEQGRPRA